MAPTSPRRRSFPIAAILALVVVTGLAPTVPVDARAVERGGTGCFEPDAPRVFHRQLVAAIRISGDLPREWARSPFIAKIVCWQGSGFDPEFLDRGPANAVWHGIFAMTTDELADDLRALDDGEPVRLPPVARLLRPRMGGVSEHGPRTPP